MEVLKEIGEPDHLTCLLRNLCVGQEAQFELDMEKWTGWNSLQPKGFSQGLV